MHRKCAQCSKELGPGASSTTKYCSRACQAAAQRTTSYLQVCEWCGKDFLHRKNKHCSTACAKAHRDAKLTDSGKRKRLAKDRKALGVQPTIGQPKKPRQLRTCEVCGKGMLLLPSQVAHGTKYCSRECYGIAVGERQKGDKHHMYKDGKSAERESVRQALRKHKSYKKWRTDVFERDEYCCRSCRATGVELHAHHVVPWVDDPKLRLKVSNGVTLCDECHRLWHLYDRKGYFDKKESLLQQKIIDALRAYGFYVYNVPGTPLGVNGTPDILVCYNGLFGGVEVKVFPNYLSELQKKAGERIAASGGIFYVAQSEDDIGRIIELFSLKSATGDFVVNEVSGLDDLEYWLTS